MKKMLSLLAVSSLVLCAGVQTDKSPAKPAVKQEAKKKIPFSRIQDFGKKGKIKSAIFLYEINGNNVKDLIFMVRADQNNRVRFDMTVGEKTYTTCRNGNQFWSCSPKRGIVYLSKKEIQEMIRDIAFLPLKFYKGEVYAPIEDAGEAKIDGKSYLLYKTHALSGPKLDLQIWVDKETELPVKVLAQSDDGISETVFRAFKDYSGIHLPSNMTIVSPQGMYTMKLRSLALNTRISDDVFFPKTNVAAPKAVFKDEPTRTTTKRRVSSNYVKQLEKKVRRLEIEIKDGQHKLKLMEDSILSNKKDTVNLSNTTGRSSNSYYGWGYYSRGGSHDSNLRRRTVRNLDKENKKLVDEYEFLSKQTMEKQIQLADAKAELEEIKGK